MPLTYAQFSRLRLNGFNQLYICENKYIKEENRSVTAVYRAEMPEIENGYLVEYSTGASVKHDLKEYGYSWVAYYRHPLVWEVWEV